MRTKVAVVLGLAVLAVVVRPAAAEAKGPAEGIIDGEGLDAPIVIGAGEGTPRGDRLIEDVGFFEAVFGQTPTRMLDEAPTVALGPMLRIRWTVPGPSAEADVIVQDLYPYAANGPLVYTAPGQRFFTTERTRGGWFQAPARLVSTLAALGVPDDAALGSSRGGDGGGARGAAIGASLAAVVLMGAGLLLRSRRRSEVAPAAG